MSGDRTLVMFRANALAFVAEIVDTGFDDLPELARKIEGLRNEIDQLEVKACVIAGEQVDRIAREERTTSVPPVEVGNC